MSKFDHSHGKADDFFVLLHVNSPKRRARALPVQTSQTLFAVRVLETLDSREVHVLGHTRHVRRIELSEARRTLASGRVGNNLAHGVGAALGKVHARVGALALQTRRLEIAVVVEVTTVHAFFLPLFLIRHANLSEGAICVSSTSGEADAVLRGSAVDGVALLAKLTGEAVGIVETNLNATAVDATFAQRAFFVPLAGGQTKVPHAHVVGRARVTAGGAQRRRLVRGTFCRCPHTTVSRIRNAVSGNAAESVRTRANRLVGIRRALGIGTASVGDLARVVTGFDDANCRCRRSHEKRRADVVDLYDGRRCRRRSRQSGSYSRCRRRLRRLNVCFNRIPSDLLGHFDDDSESFAVVGAGSRLLDNFDFLRGKIFFARRHKRIIQSDEIFILTFVFLFFLLLHKVGDNFDSFIVVHSLRGDFNVFGSGRRDEESRLPRCRRSRRGRRAHKEWRPRAAETISRGSRNGLFLRSCRPRR